MLRLAQPEFLWLLLLIPLLVVVFTLSRARRARLIKRFGNPELMAQLMPDVSKRRPWFKLFLILFAFLFFIVGLSRPQMGATLKEVKRNGIELIIALDVSNSMMAEDFKPNRLERAKMAISRLVDRMRDDRIGLVVFAGDAYVQLPVTSDYVSAKMFLSSINPGIVSKQGTAIGKAINTAATSFSQESAKSKVLVLISDGENHEDDAVEAAKKAADMGILIYTIGVGSPNGVPIPINGQMLKDKNGEVVISKLDEIALADIAKAGKGFYTRAADNDLGLGKLVDEVQKMDKQEFSALMFQSYNELFMYFFAIALGLLIFDLLLLERKNKWLSSIDIFRIKK